MVGWLGSSSLSRSAMNKAAGPLIPGAAAGHQPRVASKCGGISTPASGQLVSVLIPPHSDATPVTENEPNKAVAHLAIAMCCPTLWQECGEKSLVFKMLNVYAS